MMSESMVIPIPLPDGSDPFAQFNTPASPILFPVGERKAAWESRTQGYMPTNNYKAIVRLNQAGDGGQLLNIVGANYKLVHNRELFGAIEAAMRDEMLPEHLTSVKVHDSVAGWGSTCYRQYIFPSIKCRLPSTRSDIAFRIIVQNGYGGSALRVHAGAIDFYCTNGMIRGDYTSTYRKHTKGLMIGNLNVVVQKALLEFANGQAEWTKWAETPVKHNNVVALFDSISVSPKMKEHLLDQYTREMDARGPNLWAVYSTLTYYASHSDGVFSLRRSVEEMDTLASTMLKRELNVAKWTRSDEWRTLEVVA